MNTLKARTSMPCTQCADRDGSRFDQPISMAFQPIFDAATGEVYAHEALVRAPNGDGAAAVLNGVTPQNRYSFDQTCRATAIRMAAALGMNTRLCINCLPNAVLHPRNCLRTTIIAARRYGFPIENIIFEFTESEAIENIDHFKAVVAAYKDLGFRTAFDDFGAGYSGLGLLSDIQPDMVKLDLRMIRNIDHDIARRHIVDACLRMCMDMNIEVIVEGVETPGEFRHLRDAGARLFQGFLLGRPQFAQLLHESDFALPCAA